MRSGVMAPYSLRSMRRSTKDRQIRRSKTATTPLAAQALVPRGAQRLMLAFLAARTLALSTLVLWAVVVREAVSINPALM